MNKEESSAERGDPIRILLRAHDHILAHTPGYLAYFYRRLPLRARAVEPDLEGARVWPVTRREFIDVGNTIAYVLKLLQAPDQWRVFDL